ncbi:phage antirepressor KilAC domain-containing protein [Arthrobacter sp. EpRS71]|uniref:phage antirepressor n=1 Tax=Arthrobacter sp. EpRS71 TaxID=1743141 RepID=UPI0007476184|nr:phage antirepressor KilAC domain-containing protein [Arthrobacter sp. EpRS71]KUM34582.1 antirepressor [Arthrobacter sp. EpRS71]
MNTLQKFNFNSQQVRTLVIESEPWFVLADLCAVLEIRNVGNVAARIDEAAVRQTDISSGGQRRNVTIVNESGMYEVVIRSDKAEAVNFRRWITGEVLPAIRKTGAYGTALPQTYAEALRELASSVEATAALEAKVAADAPKVLFADSVATSETTILVGDLAKILRGNGVEVGANRLFALLREDGYLIRRQGTDWNMPTQRSMELGLFKVKETAVTHSDGHVTVSKTPKVSGKGQTYFINRYSTSKDLVTQ